MAQKTELTPEEEAQIPGYFEKYIKMQTEAQPDEDIVEIVGRIWKKLEHDAPKVHIMDSPIAAKEACPDPDNFHVYWSIWFSSYAAMYDFASNVGVEFNEDDLDTFLKWTRCIPFILFNETDAYVSRRPTELHFNEDNQLHNEEGMACNCADGWGVWSINGVQVDEQIVMDPKSQTLQQIRDEQNEEIKRIRIERYGFESYLAEIDARLIERVRNDIEGTIELLYDADDMRFLMCICPSTAKEFCLEVPTDTKTCKAAQSYLSAGLSDRIISAS